jgi:hypothetical protein
LLSFPRRRKPIISAPKVKASSQWIPAFAE